MKDKVFIDTNLLIYSISSDSTKAIKIERLLTEPFDFIISTQVINEFVHTCNRKNLLSSADIRQVVESFLLFFNLATIQESTILAAFDLRSRYNFSWYDALIVSVAIEHGCSILYSEDMQHGLSIDNQLVIQNPLLI